MLDIVSCFAICCSESKASRLQRQEIELEMSSDDIVVLNLILIDNSLNNAGIGKTSDLQKRMYNVKAQYGDISTQQVLFPAKFPFQLRR